MGKSSPDPVDLYLKDIGSIQSLSLQEEQDLFRRMNAGDAEARKKIIRCNLKLVVKIAKKYARLGVPFMDLVEEGNLGLLRACQKYDLTKGCKFSTYASWWIKQFIMRALANQGKTIRLPVYMVDRLAKVERAINNIRAKFNATPTLEDIAHSTQLPREKVVEIFSIAQRTHSINAMLNEDSEFEDILEDKNALHAERIVSNAMIQEEVIDLLGHLKPRETDIISKRFGLDGERASTLKEIGEHYGISRERVRQIEEAALRKLKKLMKKKGILYSDIQ